MPWSAPQGTEAPGHFSRRGFQGESALKARPPVDWLIRLASRNSATRSCGDLSWPRSETVVTAQTISCCASNTGAAWPVTLDSRWLVISDQQRSRTSSSTALAGGLPRKWAGCWRRAASMVALGRKAWNRSEEHTSELQSQSNLVCRLLLEKKKKKMNRICIQ